MEMWMRQSRWEQAWRYREEVDEEQLAGGYEMLNYFGLEDFDANRDVIYEKSRKMYLDAGRNSGFHFEMVWDFLNRVPLVFPVTKSNGKKGETIKLALCSSWKDDRPQADRERAASVYADDVLEELHDRLKYGEIYPGKWKPSDGAPRKEDTR